MFYIIFSFIWWQIISAVAVSAGYHRYFSHRTFNAPIWYEYVVLLLGPLSGSGPVLSWAGVHRMHHLYSDTHEDPHSPKYKGFLKILFSAFGVTKIPRRFIKDLIKNKRVMFFYKHHLKIRILSGIIGILVLPFTWFLVIFVSPFVYGYLGFGLINALCHRKGIITNSLLANIFTAGEGWHKNHHDDSRDWQIGKKWWQWDTGALVIRIIKI